MNTVLWAVQVFLAVVFLYSGFCKATQPEQRLVAMGQTGVEGLAAPFIKVIGISELAGVAGLLLPWALHIVPALTPLTAYGLGFIMLPAARIHYKRKEYRQVVFNIFIGLLCAGTGYARWQQL